MKRLWRKTKTTSINYGDLLGGVQSVFVKFDFGLSYLKIFIISCSFQNFLRFFNEKKKPDLFTVFSRCL